MARKPASTAASKAREIQTVTSEKLALFVKLREIHLEITKANQRLAELGADARMISICW